MTRQHREHLYPWNATQHSIVPAWASASILLLALLIAGCGAAASPDIAGPARGLTSVPSGSSSIADRLGPMVVLHNPAPGTLAVSMAVTFDQSAGDTQQMLVIGLGFESGGESVQFAGNERVTCNGVDLPLKYRAADFQVLSQPAAQVIGTTVRCDYSAGGAVASIAVQIPTPPTITFPQPGARVARSAHTLVTYHYDPATSTLMGIVALAPSSRPPKALSKMNTPGPLQATVDTSAFAPGPGSLALTASLTPRMSASGVPFASVSAFGMATSQVDVTWV
jgi:hypothetical protein